VDVASHISFLVHCEMKALTPYYVNRARFPSEARIGNKCVDDFKSAAVAWPPYWLLMWVSVPSMDHVPLIWLRLV